MTAAGPWLPRSDRTEMGPLSEEHRPRIRAPGKWSARPSLPSRPGEFHPEPLTDPYVNLSIHTARVIAQRLPPSAEPSGSSRFDPVGPCSTTMTCLLGSAGIIPTFVDVDSSASLPGSPAQSINH